jgi:hypothetical protein|tara:strand:- start:400 stop:2223 length:1824 start_codon:yes stop_codon:yes gene_type:complete
MALGILVLITALSISAVAIYYSIAGLVAIFAAAAIPIMIMGGVLEVGKLVTAVWLHKYWSQAKWWLKYYLATAVLVLMFITSMGIFGFLSKAHIEQTSASVENVAQVEQIDKQIAQFNAVISRAEDTINKTETSGTGADQNIQAQIDKEQERINTAYDRVKPAIDETNAQLKEDSKLYTDQIKAVDVELKKLASISSIDTSDRDAVKLLQQLVGARPDGRYGSGTAKAVKEFKVGLETKKQTLFVQIEELKTTAKEEVKRLRARAELEIDDSNKLIERLRKQLGTDTGVDIDAIIDEQNLRIKTANTELDILTEEKFTIEAEYRKLEAEVGPIKYIAEFVYGEAADKTMLEEAVRWVIIIIIFVFDPLAVLLLIASQYTFDFARKNKKNQEWRDYETRRGNAIARNEGPKDQTPDQEDNPEEYKFEDVDQETLDKEFEDEEEQELDIDKLIDEEIKSINQEISEEAKAVAEEYKDKETTKPRLTEEQIDELDQHPDWTEAKRKWKDMNPNRTIKSFKEKYLLGEIDEFPWESYLDDDDNDVEKIKNTYKETATVEEALKLPENESVQTPINEDVSSDSNETTVDSGYIQNEEQTKDTNWKAIRDKNE